MVHHTLKYFTAAD